MSAALELPVVEVEAPRAGVDLDPDVERIVSEARAWCVRSVGLRERLAGYVVGGLFLAFALALFAIFPAVRTPSIFAYAFFVGAYALASRVEFEVGPGFALPTQLVLVPMLFVLPLRVVPLCVVAGLLLGDFAAGRGRLNAERVPLRFANAWHAVGPVLVLGAAGAPAPELRHAPVFAVALAAQLAFDFASTSTLEWFRVGLQPRVLLRYVGWTYAIDVVLSISAMAFAVTAVARPSAVVLTFPLVGLLAYFARERKQRIDHALELSHAYRGTAMLLGDVVEADDEYTGEHSRDVVNLVVAVCDLLGLDARERRNAEFAALLHDIGKVRIPSEIINKPGPLNAAERAIINRHTIEGERMLDKVGGLLGDVGRIVRSSHEHWDGNGYPDRLAGDAIPLAARIVTTCDSFSAMTTTRSYRRAMSHDEAVAELRRCAGTQFDPRVVEALVAVAATAERIL